MALKKKTKIEEVETVEEILPPAPVLPDFDPTLPESKQRHLR